MQWRLLREGIVPLLDSIPTLVKDVKNFGRSGETKTSKKTGSTPIEKTGSSSIKKFGASPVSTKVKTPLFSRKSAGTLTCPACAAVGFSETTLV